LDLQLNGGFQAYDSEGKSLLPKHYDDLSVGLMHLAHFIGGIPYYRQSLVLEKVGSPLDRGDRTFFDLMVL